MKHEIKIEFKDNNLLTDLIKSCYKNGVLVDRTKKLVFEKDTHIFNLCKGLSNHTARLWNEELIDGTIRLIIQEENDTICLYPCSIRYEMDNNKYSFLI